GGGAVWATIVSAKRQVAAADRQVTALNQQLEDVRAARRQADERRLSVIKWAVVSEGRRLGTAAEVMKRDALPAAPGWAARAREQLIIESSELLRGEREDIALLDDPTRALLEEVASTLDAYNLRIQTAPGGQEGPQIVAAALERINQLSDLAEEL